MQGHKSVSAVLAGAAIAGALTSASMGQVSYRVVAVTGTQAPGVAEGVVLSKGDEFSMYGVRIDVEGRVLMRAGLAGPGVDESNDIGLWVEDAPGQLRLLVREGDVAPGVTDGSVVAWPRVSRVVMNRVGDVACFLETASLEGEEARTGLWLARAGEPLRPVVRSGEAAAGFDEGQVLAPFRWVYDTMVLSGGGRLAFTTEVLNANGSSAMVRGLWTAGYGEEPQRAVSDESTVDLNGEVFAFNGGGTLRASSSDAGLCFVGSATSQAQERVPGLWRIRSGGEIQPTFLEDRYTQGLPEGMRWDYLSDVSTSVDGSVVVRASIESGGSTPERSQGLWRFDESNRLHEVMQEGRVVSHASGVYSLLDPLWVVACEEGRTLFSADAVQMGDGLSIGDGLWSASSDGRIDLIAARGWGAAGIDVRANYGNFPWLVNDLRGGAVFKAVLEGDGVNSYNRSGIWVWDANNGTRLLVRQGESIRISDTLRTTIGDADTARDGNDDDGYGLGCSPSGSMLATLRLHSGDIAIVVYDLTTLDACRGDLADSDGPGDADGVVDVNDFMAMLGLLGPCEPGVFGCAGDIADESGYLEIDGRVDFGDFIALLSLTGPCP